MEEENVIWRKERAGVPAYISLLVYLTAFGVLSFVLAQLVYVFFIPARVTNVALLTVPQLLLLQSTTLLAGLIPAMLMLRYLDYRPFSDLGFSIKGRGKDVVYGALAAVALYAVGFGLSLGLGLVEVVGVHVDWGWLIGSFFFYLLVSVAEELVFRGYILGRLLRTRMNKFLSLGLTSFLFTCLHLMNPNLDFLPLLNLFLAGLLLGATSIYTRNLWFPISLHLFWNWLQGPVLGYEVSGNKLGESLLKLHLSNNTLLNGGAFGFEGSLLCTVLMVVLTVGIIYVKSNH